MDAFDASVLVISIEAIHRRLPVIPQVDDDWNAPSTSDGDDAPPKGHRADIQGLRAIAVGLVVAYHARLPVPGGFIGVDMFFVISGFVITAMLLRQLEKSSKISFGTFYTRRMRRLLPALGLVIVFVAAASAFLLSPLGPQQATATTGVAASLFVANVQLFRAGGGGYFALSVETNALLHTWSLSVEEQFYLVFPAFLLVLWRLGARLTSQQARRRSMACVVLTASVLSFALSWWASGFNSISGIARFGFYSPVTRAWEFGVGVLLALAEPTLVRMTKRLAGGLGIAGLAMVGIGTFCISRTTPFPGTAALWPVIGTALILVAGAGATRGVTSALAWRPAVWVGDVSYGWYLWHWPLIVFAGTMWPGNTMILVAAGVAALGPTWLSYRLLENPIRFNNRLTGRRLIPVALISIAAPICACLALLAIGRFERHTTVVTAYSTAARFHADSNNGCDNAAPIGTRQGTACTWTVENPKGTIFLVGDSNAGQFIEPVAKAANDAGYNLTVATLSSCPFNDVLKWPVSGVDRDTCYRFVKNSIDAMTSADPNLVIIASASSAYVNTTRELRDPRTHEAFTKPEAKAQLWEAGLTTVLGRFQAAGIPVLVVHTVPHFGDWPRSDPWTGDATACPFIKMYTHSCDGDTISRTFVERQQQLTRDAEDRAIANVPGSFAVDFTNDLCRTDSCKSKIDDLLLYRNSDHLSVDGSLTLTDKFRQLIIDHASHQ